MFKFLQRFWCIIMGHLWKKDGYVVQHKETGISYPGAYCQMCHKEHNPFKDEELES